MAYNDVITLRKADADDVDELGDKTFTVSDRQIFARTASIGMKEFYQAAGVGLRPEIKFVIADAEDYHGELIVIYHDTPYKVLRTYMTGTELEIVCYSDVSATSEGMP